MMKRQIPQQQITNTLTDVKSVDNYCSKIEKLGGRVLHPKGPAPEMGWDALQFVFIQRINSFAIWESNENDK